MPTFSNANDKTATIAISVKILFFLMKSIMHINNIFIKFLFKIRNNKNYYNNYNETHICRRFNSLNSFLLKNN